MTSIARQRSAPPPPPPANLLGGLERAFRPEMSAAHPWAVVFLCRVERRLLAEPVEKLPGKDLRRKNSSTSKQLFSFFARPGAQANWSFATWLVKRFSSTSTRRRRSVLDGYLQRRQG
jgi:hypothetical protein